MVGKKRTEQDDIDLRKYGIYRVGDAEVAHLLDDIGAAEDLTYLYFSVDKLERCTLNNANKTKRSLKAAFDKDERYAEAFAAELSKRLKPGFVKPGMLIVRFMGLRGWQIFSSCHG